MDEEQHALLVFFQRYVISGIERCVETIDQAHLLFAFLAMRFQEHGAKGRTQRQGVHGREADSDRHRQTELAVERTRGSGHEAHRNEHGHHHERDRYDRSAQLAHRVDRRLAGGSVPLIEFGVDSLHDDDRVIDDDCDRKHHSRQRQQVNAEPDQVQHEERTDKRDRNGDRRNQRRTEILQENVNDQEHENERLDQRLDHLVDRSEQEVVRVEQNDIIHTRGQRRLDPLQVAFDIVDDLRRVRTGRLKDHRRHALVTVHVVAETVRQTSQLDIGDILESQYLAVGGGAHDDVAELLLGLQTPLVAHDILERLVALLAELSGSGLDILFGQRGSYVRRHQAVLSHHIGLQPNTHRVVGTHHHRVAHAGDTLDLGNDIDVGIVLEELDIITVVGAEERETEQHTRLPLLGRHADLSHFRRQQPQRLRDTVLHIDGCHVGIGSLLEIHLDRGIAGIGRRRSHVHHVLDTVDLLLERSDHAVEHGLRIGSLITRVHPDGRRRDIGVLRNG